MSNRNKFEEDNARFYECVKDLDPHLHAGGFPARAIVIERQDGVFELYKANISPDKAINLLRSVAKNDANWVRIHSVNQKLKTRVDTAHNELRTS